MDKETKKLDTPTSLYREIKKNENVLIDLKYIQIILYVNDTRNVKLKLTNVGSPNSTVNNDMYGHGSWNSNILKWRFSYFLINKL